MGRRLENNFSSYARENCQLVRASFRYYTFFVHIKQVAFLFQTVFALMICLSEQNYVNLTRHRNEISRS